MRLRIVYEDLHTLTAAQRNMLLEIAASIEADLVREKITLAQALDVTISLARILERAKTQGERP